MAELKIRKGSLTVRLIDDDGTEWPAHTWPDAVLKPDKKLKVKYEHEQSLEPGQEKKF
jgi:hypothetical protein